MLFEGFGPDDRRIAVCGLECAARLDALERVSSMNSYTSSRSSAGTASNCSAPRFQWIAARLFGHRSHTHNLITRRERARR